MKHKLTGGEVLAMMLGALPRPAPKPARVQARKGPKLQAQGRAAGSRQASPGAVGQVRSAEDGLGWYVVEGEEGQRALRDDVRYNLKAAAKSTACFRWPGETLGVMFWDGREWDRASYETVA